MINRLLTFLSACMCVLAAPNTHIVVDKNGAFSFVDPSMNCLSLELYQDLMSSVDDPENIFPPGTCTLDEFYARSKRLCEQQGYTDFKDCIVVGAGERSYWLKQDVFGRVIESGILQTFFPHVPFKCTGVELKLFSLAISLFGGSVMASGRGSFDPEQTKNEFLTRTGSFTREAMRQHVKPEVEKFMKNLLKPPVCAGGNLDQLD